MSDPESFLDWFRNAAPYFNAHRWRRMVVFAGGELLRREDDFVEFVHDLALVHSLGVRLVLVPGIRPQIETCLAERGLSSRVEGGLRVTEAGMMPAVRDAAAQVTTELQARLSMGLANSPMQGARIRVISGNFITARPMGVLDGVDYGYTGSVRRVDRAGVASALDEHAVVLIPPLGYSPTGETFNLLSEHLATAVAVELAADKLLFVDDGAALSRDDGERVDNMNLNEAMAYHARIRARADSDPNTVRRFEAALHACRNGVTRVHLLDARRRGALPLELYSRDGVGTMINADAYDNVRRATIEDVAGILELIEPLERDGVLVRRSRPDIERTINHYFVEQRDGAIVACAAVHPVGSEPVMELACLAVRSDYRDSGRGEQLLAAVEAEARRQGAGRLFVLTTQSTHWFRERGFDESDVDSLPVERQALYNWQRRSKVLVKDI